jgi:hypothetical protein
VEKISSIVCQVLWKEQSEILRFAKLIPEKGNSDDCPGIEKAKSKRIQKK